MIEIHASTLEMFFYALIFILVLFALGYMTALLDFVKGFSKEEAKKTEEEIKRMLGEVYGEVKNDTAHRIPQDGV